MLALAAILLTTPAGTPESCPPAERFPALRDAIHQVAVEWEILDPRETRYVLARPEDFCADLNMLRRRHQDLKDAPRLTDALRFPDSNEANQRIRFNWAFRSHLYQREQLELDRADVIQAAIRRSKHLYKVWDSVRDARCEFYYVTVRREALKKLRDLVGEPAFHAAELPPEVPLEVFGELK